MAWRSAGFARTFSALRPTPAAQIRKRLLPSEGPALYIIGGADAWLRGRALRTVASHHLGEQPAPYRRRRLNGLRTKRDQLESAARTVSFEGAPVVIVENATRLVQPPRTKAGRRLGEAFLGLVTEPPGKTVIAVEWERDPDRRRKEWRALGKALAAAVKEKRAVAVDADPPPESRMPAWIRSAAGERGLALPDGGAELLAERFGSDLRRQTNEIEKLLAFTGDDGAGAVSMADMEAVLGGGSLRDRFRFTNSVERGDTAQALEALDRLLGEGEHPTVLLPLLYRTLVRLQLAQAWKPGRESLAGAVGAPPRVAEDLRRTAARFTAADLRRLLREAAATDLRLKSSSLDGRAALTALAGKPGRAGEGGRGSGRPDG